MELYVCWGRFPAPWRPGGHPCGNAYKALRAAGWHPEVKKTYGLGPLPGALSPQRKRVRELTGQNWVPVLVTDDGEVIRESKAIAEWARANPAGGADRAAGQAGGPGAATTT
jgi:hypothetical protein